MKTLLISKTVLPLVFLCVTSWCHSQTHEHEMYTTTVRPNVNGYGTTLISYQLPANVVCTNVDKLKEYAMTFDGVTNLNVDSDSVDIQFDSLENARRVELIFRRMEVVYLQFKPTKN